MYASGTHLKKGALRPHFYYYYKLDICKTVHDVSVTIQTCRLRSTQVSKFAQYIFYCIIKHSFYPLKTIIFKRNFMHINAKSNEQ